MLNKYNLLSRKLFALLLLVLVVFFALYAIDAALVTEEVILDDNRVVFSCGTDQESELYSIRQDGTNLYQLTHNQYADNFPQWSPDQEWIVFSSEGRQRSLSDYQSDIYRIRFDGSDLQNLTQDDERDILPVWSPDGRQIAFSSKETLSGSDIWLLDNTTKNIQQLTTQAFALNSAWSVDGQSIVYSGEGNVLRKINLSTKEDVIISSALAIGSLAWSQNGEMIAVSYSVDGIGMDIGIVSSEGGEIESLTNLSGASSFPKWLNDSEILFLNSGSIYKVNSNSRLVNEIIDLQSIVGCGVNSFDWFVSVN